MLLLQFAYNRQDEVVPFALGQSFGQGGGSKVGLKIQLSRNILMTQLI